MFVGVLALASMSAAQGKPQTFIGTITDSMCSMADHSKLQMGPTDAECVKACVAAHGAAYVLYDVSGKYETRVAGKDVIFRAGINTLFNRRYWTSAYGYYVLPGATRTAVASATLQF